MEGLIYFLSCLKVLSSIISIASGIFALVFGMEYAMSSYNEKTKEFTKKWGLLLLKLSLISLILAVFIPSTFSNIWK